MARRVVARATMYAAATVAIGSVMRAPAGPARLPSRATPSAPPVWRAVLSTAAPRLGRPTGDAPSTTAVMAGIASPALPSTAPSAATTGGAASGPDVARSAGPTAPPLRPAVIPPPRPALPPT